MTGAEIVGGAVVAAKGVKAAADALGGDADERRQLARLGEDLPAMSIAAQATAHRVAIRQKVLTKLWTPLAKWVDHKIEYFDSGRFADDMAEKLIEVPPEHIVSPAPIVAVQSVEGLSYSLEEPNLKDMYLNLLTTASDGRRAHDAHPSYAQIIKQLSAREAGHLEGVLSGTSWPIVELRNGNAGAEGGFRAHYRHLVNLMNLASKESAVDKDYSMFVDNWIRLGLVVVEYDAELMGEDVYGWVDGRPEYLEAKEVIGAQEGRLLQVKRGVLRVTDLGKRFHAAVATDPPEVAHA
jgi:hypothetical protein